MIKTAVSTQSRETDKPLWHSSQWKNLTIYSSLRILVLLCSGLPSTRLRFWPWFSLAKLNFDFHGP